MHSRDRTLTLSSIEAKLMKLLLQQPRPVGATKFDKTYGMPSTHSCSIAFFAVYLSLCLLLLPLHPRLVSLFAKFASNNPTTTLLDERKIQAIRVGLATILVTTAGAVCWSRVKLGHHTSAQVLAGIALGGLVALGWLILWVGVDAPLKSVTITIRGEKWGLRRYGAHGLREAGTELDSALEHVVHTVMTAWKENGIAGVKSINYRVLISDRNKES